MLGSTQPSTLTPLGIAQRQQQQERVSRGGFNTSEVAHSEPFQGYYRDMFQISPGPAEQPLPPLNQPPVYPENDNVAAGTRTKDKTTAKTLRQLELKVTSLTREKDSKDKLIQELKSEVKQLTEDVEERDSRISELLQSIRGKKGKKSRKEEQKQDVNEAIKEHVKFVLFRTTKFAAGEELTLATKKVWAGIKDKKRLDKGANELTETDFVEICESAVSAALSDNRQCVQTRTHSCVKSE